MEAGTRTPTALSQHYLGVWDHPLLVGHLSCLGGHLLASLMLDLCHISSTIVDIVQGDRLHLVVVNVPEHCLPLDIETGHVGVGDGSVEELLLLTPAVIIGLDQLKTHSNWF